MMAVYPLPYFHKISYPKNLWKNEKNSIKKQPITFFKKLKRLSIEKSG
jgi:hypothetical protein